MKSSHYYMMQSSQVFLFQIVFTTKLISNSIKVSLKSGDDDIHVVVIGKELSHHTIT